MKPIPPMFNQRTVSFLLPVETDLLSRSYERASMFFEPPACVGQSARLGTASVFSHAGLARGRP